MIVVHDILSQSPENGSRHCKLRAARWAVLLMGTPSQSPENGSRHCKSRRTTERTTDRQSGRNPLKTGLGTASIPKEAR